MPQEEGNKFKGIIHCSPETQGAIEVRHERLPSALQCRKCGWKRGTAGEEKQWATDCASIFSVRTTQRRYCASTRRHR